MCICWTTQPSKLGLLLLQHMGRFCSISMFVCVFIDKAFILKDVCLLWYHFDLVTNGTGTKYKVKSWFVGSFNILCLCNSTVLLGLTAECPKHNSAAAAVGHRSSDGPPPPCPADGPRPHGGGGPAQKATSNRNTYMYDTYHIINIWIYIYIYINGG